MLFLANGIHVPMIHSREKCFSIDPFQLNRKKKRDEKWKNKRRGKEKDGETARFLLVLTH